MDYKAVFPILLAACGRADAAGTVLYTDASISVCVVEGGRIRITVLNLNRTLYQLVYDYVRSVLIGAGHALDLRDCLSPGQNAEQPWVFSFEPAD